MRNPTMRELVSRVRQITESTAPSPPIDFGAIARLWEDQFIDRDRMMSQFLDAHLYAPRWDDIPEPTLKQLLELCEYCSSWRSGIPAVDGIPVLHDALIEAGLCEPDTRDTRVLQLIERSIPRADIPLDWDDVAGRNYLWALAVHAVLLFGQWPTTPFPCAYRWPGGAGTARITSIDRARNTIDIIANPAVPQGVSYLIDRGATVRRVEMSDVRNFEMGDIIEYTAPDGTDRG